MSDELGQKMHPGGSGESNDIAPGQVNAGELAMLGLALWGTEPAQMLASHAALAERVGFESAWIIDSQLLCREVYVTLAACIAQTTCLRLATGVTQPTTRHSSVAASAMATLNEMAPGRVMLGLGSGFSSLRTIGKRAARIQEVEDYAVMLRQLLGARQATFDDGVQAGLSWLSEPTGVPIHMAASGPRMTRSAGRVGDGAILLQGIAPDLLDRAIGWLDEGILEAGRPERVVEISCWVPFSLDAHSKRARDRVRTRVASALMQANPDWFEGDERQAIETLKQRYKVGDHAQAEAEHAAIVPDSLVRKFAVAGDAEEVREQLLTLRTHPRLSRVILTPQVPGEGAMPTEEVLRLFGEAGLRQS
jgi:5,10-methylenetetrahydromethanopterin reductase